MAIYFTHSYTHGEKWENEKKKRLKMGWWKLDWKSQSVVGREIDDGGGGILQTLVHFWKANW